ncbi:MAG: pyridoxamine 5'-phosphate oxidase family protein [Treponema sp.]|nr:pyridoxamine 5'-phosphate oxidase family protein [Treponema sp.]
MTAYGKAEKLHKNVRTFIISCVGGDGYPLVKAVVPGKHRFSLREIYFCTNTSSKFAHEIVQNPKASIYFYSKLLIWEGCMLKGNMEIVSDIETKSKYWQNKFKDAYPEKSYSDPDFCLLRFVPISGRFYSLYRSDDFEI